MRAIGQRLIKLADKGSVGNFVKVGSRDKENNAMNLKFILWSKEYPVPGHNGAEWPECIPSQDVTDNIDE